MSAYRRLVPLAFGLLASGCVTNTNLSSNSNQTAQQSAQQSAQLAPGLGGARPAPRPVPPAPPRQTPAALMAGAREVRTHVTTASGSMLLLASPQSLQRDCTELGKVEAKVVRAPDHGTITVAPGTAFPHFTPGDSPYACNGRRLPATVISYRSEAGYTGEDRGEVQIFFPDGKAPVLVYDISVR